MEVVLARAQGGSGNWSEATTAREAIRKTMLLPPRKLPGWVSAAAAEAERRLAELESEDPAPTGSSVSSEEAATGDSR